MERRIARMEGQTTSEEKEELEKKIKELTKTLENRQQTFNLVDTQVRLQLVLFIIQQIEQERKLVRRATTQAISTWRVQFA